MEHLHTTICALATPPGEGGIATVRVSGPDAYGIVGKIFAPVRQCKSVADAKGYTAMLGHYLLHGAASVHPPPNRRRMGEGDNLALLLGKQQTLHHCQQAIATPRKVGT